MRSAGYGVLILPVAGFRSDLKRWRGVLPFELPITCVGFWTVSNSSTTMNTTTAATSEPCPYVNLQDHSWAIRPIFLKPRGRCHGISLDWNFTVLSLFVAFHSVGLWMALAIIINAFSTFKRWSTIYFWYSLSHILLSTSGRKQQRLSTN